MKNTSQKYDDPAEDQKYRRALLEPLQRAVWLNQHFDEYKKIIDQQNQNMDEKYRKAYFNKLFSLLNPSG